MIFISSDSIECCVYPHVHIPKLHYAIHTIQSSVEFIKIVHCSEIVFNKQHLRTKKKHNKKKKQNNNQDEILDNRTLKN